jgi:hypothetical protein
MHHNKFMKKLIFTFLFLSTQAFSSTPSELGLYFIPSPFGIDWATPSSLAMTAAKNKFSFKSHFMGHVWVEIKCGDKHELTGMVAARPDYLNQILIQQRGLGVLYHSFEGRLETKSDIEAERKELYQEGRINFVKFNLNPSQCNRVFQYATEYRKQNVGRYYGLANRPRWGEGSGCSAFGASFVDVLNILDHDMKLSWSQSVKIPLELAGPPVREETVSIFKILTHSKSWAKDNEPHKLLTFWDPDLMYKWVNKKISQKQAGYSIEKIANAQGVVFDKAYFPTPEEPIWQQQLDPKNPKQTSKE